LLKDIYSEDPVPPDHPLLKLRPMVDAVLHQLSVRLKAMDSNRYPVIPREKPLRAIVLRLLYSVRREPIQAGATEVQPSVQPTNPWNRVRMSRIRKGGGRY